MQNIKFMKTQDVEYRKYKYRKYIDFMETRNKFLGAGQFDFT